MLAIYSILILGVIKSNFKIRHTPNAMPRCTYYLTCNLNGLPMSIKLISFQQQKNARVLYYNN